MLALAIAVAAIVVATAVAIMVVTTRRTSDRLLQRGLTEIRQQMDTLALELAQTVEKIHEDATRARIVESLGQALDLDEVVARCAEAAASFPRVAGAVAGIDTDGDRHLAAAGLPLAGPTMVSGPPDGSSVRAIGVSYHYAADDDSDSALRSAIAVPIGSGDHRVGFLTVFGFSEEPPVAGPEFKTLEAIAFHGGTAIQNVRRRTANAHRSATDVLTGLGNRSAFHEALGLEVARAHRHGRALAVCVLDVDDFKLANARLGHIAGDELLVELADLVRETLRATDLAFRTGGDQFAVLLPAAHRIEAESLFVRLQSSLRRRPISPGPALSLSAGIAELEADDDGMSLLERAERALRHAKEAGKGTAA